MEDKELYGNTGNYIEVLKAHKAGKKIEVRPKGEFYEWRDLDRTHDGQGNDDTAFDFGCNYYRVKIKGEKTIDIDSCGYTEFCDGNGLEEWSCATSKMFEAYKEGTMDERGFDVGKLSRPYRNAYVDRLVKKGREVLAAAEECFDTLRAKQGKPLGNHCVSEEEVSMYMGTYGKLDDCARWAFELMKKNDVIGRPMVGGEYCRFETSGEGLKVVSTDGTGETIPWPTVASGKIAEWVQSMWVEKLINVNSLFSPKCRISPAGAEVLARSMTDSLREKYGDEKMGYSLPE